MAANGSADSDAGTGSGLLSDFSCCDIQAGFPELCEGRGFAQRRKLAAVGNHLGEGQQFFNKAECPCTWLAMGQERCYPAFCVRGELRPGDLSMVTKRDVVLEHEQGQNWETVVPARSSCVF